MDNIENRFADPTPPALVDREAAPPLFASNIRRPTDDRRRGFETARAFTPEDRRMGGSPLHRRGGTSPVGDRLPARAHRGGNPAAARDPAARHRIRVCRSRLGTYAD